jgi:biotin carboxyl carrier protein
MKRIVNGAQVDLEPSGAQLSNLPDRLLVRTPAGTNSAVSIKNGDIVLVSYRGRQYRVEPVRAQRSKASASHDGELVSPMPGQVVDVLVVLGDKVETGQKLLVLEAMKTQQAFNSPFDGKIVQLTVRKGEQVSEGLLMVKVEPEKESS